MEQCKISGSHSADGEASNQHDFLTGSFNSVTAYHVICYDQLLYNKINGKEQDEKEKLTSSFVQQGPADRGIDKLKIDADFAEEYCFLLANKGYASNINSRNLPLFIQMMKKIQFVSGNNKPILLKNPYDLAHFLFIKEKIPNAKFVFIHRNPYHVLSSMMKAIRYLFKGKDLYGIQLNRIYKRVIENPVLTPHANPCGHQA